MNNARGPQKYAEVRAAVVELVKAAHTGRYKLFIVKCLV
jgi:hypothetical protein